MTCNMCPCLLLAERLCAARQLGLKDSDDRKMPAIVFKQIENFLIAHYRIVANLRRFMRLLIERDLASRTEVIRSTLHNEDLCGALTTSHFASWPRSQAGVCRLKTGRV
ncbi:hypothetical protein BCR37DRAFT_382814 [Protomyces lactucae-debilis]|uniref:Uncharacterized protein n=1 Tax=Protomyces lactucae-debilis TaxID=2754530 RepID=A0A1Y2F0F6_PROLT|nr:uncharacterized protein BCR37DRAFT_382814 [Protomyces lactucae-debilis]ORY77329.1 hypothetical protein BCR37DRAFT_382814 [Protomyces lactucae-debilis]